MAQKIFEDLLIGRLDAVDEVLQSRLQSADRRSQLVRCVRDEIAPHPIELLELPGHRVERARELTDLVT